MKSYQLKNLNVTNSIFLIASPIIAVLGTAWWLSQDGFSWGIVLMTIIFYYATGMGITVGYHRLFAHRSYKTNGFVKAILLIFGGCALQNSALKWCNDHRVHHGKVDTEQDPYNINEGFFYAHMGWILLQEDIENYKFSKDLLNDPLIMLQHKFYLPMIIFFSFIFPGFLGHVLFDSFLGGFFVAGFLRVVIVHHFTFFINSLCHMLGNRPYDKKQTARDSWVMALFTFGEGYHNFHHTFQSDYRNGIKFYHYDPTKWAIKSLSLLGLAHSLKVTKQEIILEKQIRASLESIEKSSTLSERLDEKIAYLKDEFNQIIQDIHRSGQENKEALTNRMQEIILELREITSQVQVVHA